MEDWFVQEWRAEREANRSFRENVVTRLTALETTNAVEDEIAAKGAQTRVNWVGIVISGLALLVSIIAMV